MEEEDKFSSANGRGTPGRKSLRILLCVLCLFYTQPDEGYLKFEITRSLMSDKFYKLRASLHITYIFWGGVMLYFGADVHLSAEVTEYEIQMILSNDSK